jgi:putative endonuclease
VESATGGVARRANMFSVYIIQSVNGKRYTGHTPDLKRRLFEHNSGLCKTTKADSQWSLIYQESYKTREEAMKREKWLKSGVGRRFIENILTRKNLTQ